MKPAITIALVPEITKGPWVFWNDIEAGMQKASALGFDAVELFTASGAAFEPGYVEQLTSRYNIHICAVGTGAGKVVNGLTLTDPDISIRKKAIAYISEMIRFGAAFNAPAIIGSMQGNTVPGVSREDALQWLSEGLNILAEKAYILGVNLIYEPLNRYETNLFNQLPDAVAFIQKLEWKNVKLLADLFHMNIEEASLALSIEQCGEYIGHIHFADSNRMAIGFGHTDMDGIAGAIKKIDYKDYISAEIFPLPDSDIAALQAITAFKKWFK
ncbi:MAG: sugar phosphate isomerase/epimerase [Terrimonas sp.]|nr:sugar phosphate isomerase/epimerase [Terrimonas sp.]OJY90007.1 MAG: sugar phosphate isomerase [Sphingobacteriales bacterium 40-81]